jgi:hypothetical protein
VDGWPIDAGHHMAEEVPEELAATLRSFLLIGDPRRRLLSRLRDA